MPEGAVWRSRAGDAPASVPDATAWRSSGFDDSKWVSGPLPLYYGEALTGTTITGMQGVYPTYFVRTLFQVDAVADVKNLILTAACDDGFVAWINGREVARYNVPEGEPGLGTYALAAVPEPIVPYDYPAGSVEAALRVGENVAAVQVFNATLGSSDLVFQGKLTADVDRDPPTVVSTVPAAGELVRELGTVEIQFSKPVTGVDAADLWVNGVPAVSVTQPVQGQYLFVLPPLANGVVQVAIQPSSGITDVSSKARPLVTNPWTYTLDTTLPSPIRINEFVADNARGIRDEDGKNSDWIEISNAGMTPVSLGGWSLTDDPLRLRKWVFPAVSIPAGGYTLVWATGNDRTNPAAPLHTNFRMANDGEYLALVSPSGQVASAFATAYPAQRADVAYGVLPGSTNYGFLPTPTPRKANAAGGVGFAPDVELSPRSRAYTTTVELTATPVSDGGAVPAGTVVRYTTDGSLPTATSPVWAGPRVLSNQAVQVRVRAFAPGLLDGRPRTEMYLPLSPTVARFTSDVPVLIIHDFNQGRPPASTRIPAFFQVFEPGTNGIVVLTNAPAMAAAAAISVRGSSTEGLPKASLRVEFQDEFGNDRARSFLGMPAEADWVLYGANLFEPVLMHNPFMHDLSRDIGRYSPRNRFCEVFLVTSGTNAIPYSSYNGVYVAMERIETGNDRVDIGTLEPENLTAPSVTGGYLMKVDRLDPGDSGIYAAGLVFGMVEPKESELRDPARAPQMTYIQSYMNAFGDALNGTAYMDPVKGYRAYVDVPSWIDHHLLNVLAFNVDGLRLSAYFGKQRGGLLEFGPLWDFDRALGSTDGRDANPRVWTSQVGDRGTPFFTFSWWGRMFTDPEFWQAYIDRYQELRRGYFGTLAVNARIDALANVVRRAAARDWARWGASPRTASYQGEVNMMKSWLRSRLEFMDSQFVAPPAFETTPGNVGRGSAVVMTVAPNTTLYYTTDGSDPRLAGGGISPKAQVYSAPVTVASNVRLRARSRNPSHAPRLGGENPPLLSVWSGEVAGAFITDPMPLRVSEIHFRPSDGPNGAAQDFEFVEWVNIGTRTLDLTGCGLTGAVRFTVEATNRLRAIEPGQRVVVVSDLAAFTNRYPTVTRILGQYSGHLAGTGDTLTVTGSLGETVQTIPYSSAWMPEGAEPGCSLVPISEALSTEAMSQGGNWRASAAVSGSPGRIDAASLPAPAVIRISVASGDLVLELGLDAGIAAELQSRSDAVTGFWQPVVRHPAGAGRSVTVRVPMTVGERFFRWVPVVD